MDRIQFNPKLEGAQNPIMRKCVFLSVVAGFSGGQWIMGGGPYIYICMYVCNYVCVTSCDNRLYLNYWGLRVANTLHPESLNPESFVYSEANSWWGIQSTLVWANLKSSLLERRLVTCSGRG